MHLFRVGLVFGLAMIPAPTAIGNAAPPAAGAETPATEAAGPLAERAAQIGREHAALEQQFYDDLTKYRSDSAKISELNRVHWKQSGLLGRRLNEVIREKPGDPAAFSAMLIFVEQLRHPLDDELTQAVVEHHLANREMGRHCSAIGHRGGEPWVERILTAAAEKAPAREVRGLATFALGESYRSEAMPFSDPPPPARRDELLAKAAEHYRTAAERFADVPLGDGEGTLGPRARHELARLKNLPNLKVGRVAPPITGSDVDGKPLALADYRGHVVLVVFWGSWCGPCMAKVPLEKSLCEKFRDRPFVLLGVNGGDDRDTAKRTMLKHSMTWRSWWDDGETRGGPIQIEYDIQHWPTVILIGADGVIRGIDQKDEELTTMIDKLLPPQAGSAKAVETK
jgi:thiol-disulfide isomerase/thioredoxin